MDVRDSDTRGRWLRAVGTLVLVNCLLIVPVWFALDGIGPFWVSLEAAILVGLFLALPRNGWTRIAAFAGGLAVTLTSLLLFGDATARQALARPLNLYLDVRLVGAIRNLLDGMLGNGLGLVAVFGAGALTLFLGLGVGVLLASLRRRRSGWRAWAPGAVMVAVCAVAVPVRWAHPRGVVLALPASQLVTEQRVQFSRMLQERDRFGAEMAAAPARFDDRSGLLAGLGGRDVTLGFIESYGMSALDDPRYGPVVGPVLDSLADAAAARGFSVVSGVMRAPSQGGMSWLGHGSMLSGLWLDNQLRYDLLMASDRHTLVDDFEAAGYRTVAIMPAIRMAWPEGARFGYEEVWDSATIPYAGPALNWVTMPDQFVWSFLESGVRDRDDGRPLFAELGLISSHAPWTPILDPVPWDSVGDGRVFERWRDAGETPEELWRDHDRVREHFALSVRYALRTVVGYVREEMPDDAVLIALGDHQPAPMITGPDASRAVPIHVIARDPALLEPFRRWGFVEGPRPPALPEEEILRMSAFREWFVRTFSTPPRETE